MIKIVEKNFGDISYIDAISEVIHSDGNQLVLAYGYIRSSPMPVRVFGEIKSFLEKSDDNQVLIIVGMFSQKKDSEESKLEIKELSNVFSNLLGDELYTKGISDRVSVAGLENFHSKYCFMSKKNGESTRGISALIGSSNLSQPALGANNRCEMDLLIFQPDKEGTIDRFVELAYHQIEDAFRRECSTLGEGVRKRIHLSPQLAEAVNIIDLVEREKQLREFYDLKNYVESAASNEDAESLRDSDKQQGVASDD